MRLALRCIAALNLLGVVVFLATTVSYMRGHWRDMGLTPPWSEGTTLLIAGSLVSLMTGYGAMRLWAFTQEGRLLLAAALVLALLLAFTQVAAGIGDTEASITRACMAAVMVGILMSKPAERACALARHGEGAA